MSAAQEPLSIKRRPVFSQFALKLLTEWKRLGLPVAEQRLVVAVSGGADSVALILAIKELLDRDRIDLDIIIAHLDHGIRGEASREDAIWVRRLGESLGFPVVESRLSMAAEMSERPGNLEQAARLVRYEFLEKTARATGATMIATGHTMDDQAETVLLNLLRGSGLTGLAGIELVRKVYRASEILLVRPLTDWAQRVDTEKYCRRHAVSFRLDAMNDEKRFARVRVRKDLIPLMKTFNPKVVPALARAAGLLRDDYAVLEVEAAKLLHEARLQIPAEPASNETPVRVDILSAAPASLRRRALRLWIEGACGDLRRIELIHILGVERLLVGDRGGRIAQLPRGVVVRRSRGLLFIGRKPIDNGVSEV